jgi:RNA polymerase sigma-70 factor (ECF subfamily)
MNTKDVEDQILVERSLQGEQQAFEQLVERYQRSVYNLAYRMTGRREDAENLTQETFLRAFARLETFQVGRRFSPWLFRIASNLCINRKNRQERRELSLDSFSEDKKEQLLCSDTSADLLFQIEQNQMLQQRHRPQGMVHRGVLQDMQELPQDRGVSDGERE